MHQTLLAALINTVSTYFDQVLELESVHEGQGKRAAYGARNAGDERRCKICVVSAVCVFIGSTLLECP